MLFHCLLSMALTSAPAPAQTDTGPQAAIHSDNVLRLAPIEGQIRRVHSGHEGDRPWLRGRSYKAFADGEGFHYVPFLGSSASRNYPVRLQVESVTVGGRALGMKSPTSALDGQALVLDRGPLRVRYEGALESVEQIFLLDGLDEVEGDVVVSVRVSSELALTALSSGYALEGPEGGVVVGGAIALDGRGGRVELETELDADRVRYRVPEAFARRAGAGLVIDPLITTLTAANHGIDVFEPDVAYDRDNDTYCLVYTGVFSGTDRDLHYTTLNGNNLSFADGGFVELISGDAHRPKCCSLAGEDAFVVAYGFIDGSGRPEIYARARNAAPGSSWAVTYLVATWTEFTRPVRHDLGGEGFEGAGARAIVVWEKEAAAGPGFGAGIEARRLGSDAGPVDLPFTIVPGFTAFDFRLPAISKFSGDPNLHGSWWAAYSAGPVGSPLTELHATRIQFNGVITDADQVVATLPGTASITAVDVSAPYPTQNINEAVHFTAEVPVGGFPTVFLATRERSSVGPTGNRTPLQDIDINDSLLCASGALVTTQNRAGLAYNDRRNLAVTPSLLLSSLEAAKGGGTAVGERRIAFDQLAGPGITGIGTASTASGGFPAFSERVMAVWSDRTTGNHDIFAAVIDLGGPAAIGRNFCRGNLNSRGIYGFLAAFGDNSTLTAKELRGSGLPVNQFGLFVTSRTTGSAFPANSQGRLCLGGSIGRLNSSLMNSGPGGAVTYLMDPTAIPQGSGTIAAMLGETWSFQFWHRDANPTATSNFTSGVQISF